MKRVIYTLLFLSLSWCVKAQDNNQPGKTYDYFCAFYGKLQVSGKFKPHKLIWGESKKEVKLVSQDGKEIEFNNIVDVANFMSKRGWRFVNNGTYIDAFYVIFTKNVSSDDEAKEGLYFNTDFKK